jgi:hypothetical protein
LAPIVAPPPSAMAMVFPARLDVPEKAPDIAVFN